MQSSAHISSAYTFHFGYLSAAISHSCVSVDASEARLFMLLMLLLGTAHRLLIPDMNQPSRYHNAKVSDCALLVQFCKLLVCIYSHQQLLPSDPCVTK